MEIDIKGYITDDRCGPMYERYGMAAAYPAKVLKALRDAKGDDVDININSGGGDVTAANEIYTAILGYKGNVRLHVVGFAASAATVIMCAGYCDITPVGMVMVHCASTYASGNHSDMEHTAKMLSVADRAIAAAYVAKTGRSEEDVLAMMEATTWMSATDAVQAGLVNAVMAIDCNGSTGRGNGSQSHATQNGISRGADNAAVLAKYKFLKLRGEHKYEH